MKIISRKKVIYVFDHIIDAYLATQKGITRLYEKGMIDAVQYKEMIEKNAERLRVKIAEWRIAEKMSCIFFAILFSWNSMTNSPDEMIRRPSRGRRRNEKEVYYE